MTVIDEAETKIPMIGGVTDPPVPIVAVAPIDDPIQSLVH